VIEANVLIGQVSPEWGLNERNVSSTLLPLTQMKKVTCFIIKSLSLPRQLIVGYTQEIIISVNELLAKEKTLIKVSESLDSRAYTYPECESPINYERTEFVFLIRYFYILCSTTPPGDFMKILSSLVGRNKVSGLPVFKIVNLVSICSSNCNIFLKVSNYVIINLN
jgi:hypothetical protein